jgi:hypothetical protein
MLRVRSLAYGALPLFVPEFLLLVNEFLMIVTSFFWYRWPLRLAHLGWVGRWALVLQWGEWDGGWGGNGLDAGKLCAKIDVTVINL